MAPSDAALCSAESGLEVLVDDWLAATVASYTEQPPLAGNSSLLLGQGSTFIVDELTLYDQPLDDAGVCERVMGGRWCSTGVCAPP